MLPFASSPVAATAWPSPRCCSYSSPSGHVLSHDAVLQFDLATALEAGVRIIQWRVLGRAAFGVGGRSVGTKYVVTTARAVAIAFAMLSHTTRRNYRDTLAPFVMVAWVSPRAGAVHRIGHGLATQVQAESVRYQRHRHAIGGALGRRAGTVLNLRYQNMMGRSSHARTCRCRCRSSSTDHSKGTGVARRAPSKLEPNSRHCASFFVSGWTKRLDRYRVVALRPGHLALAANHGANSRKEATRATRGLSSVVDHSPLTSRRLNRRTPRPRPTAMRSSRRWRSIDRTRCRGHLVIAERSRSSVAVTTLPGSPPTRTTPTRRT